MSQPSRPSPAPVPVVHHVSARRNVVVGLVLALTVLVAIGALIFGPARGARGDISQVRGDLHSSRQDIEATLRTTRATLARTVVLLRDTQAALGVARQGLTVARSTQQLTQTSTANTTALLDQTTATLATVRNVLTTLGPLRELEGGDLAGLVRNVNTGVTLARTTLDLAGQTLTNGKAALSVAVTTLNTLGRSEKIQAQLLEIGRQTLQQVRELNAKIPSIPLLSTPTSTGR